MILIGWTVCFQLDRYLLLLPQKFKSRSIGGLFFYTNCLLTAPTAQQLLLDSADRSFSFHHHCCHLFAQRIVCSLLPSCFVCFSFTTDDGPLFKKCALVSLCVYLILAHFPLSLSSYSILFVCLNLSFLDKSLLNILLLLFSVFFVGCCICDLWSVAQAQITHSPTLSHSCAERDLFVILCCIFCRHTASVEHFKMVELCC